MSRQNFKWLLWSIITGITCLSVVPLSNDVLAEPSIQSPTVEPSIQPEVEFNPRLDIENEADQAEDEEEYSEEEDTEEDKLEEAYTKEIEVPTPPPAKAFKEFFGFNQQFTEICRELTSDGRNLAFYELVLAHADDYKFSCAACRALLKSFEVPCKPKRIKGPKAKKGDPPLPTPTPIRRQREPHPELISITSSLFGELSKSTKAGDDIVRAIRELDRLVTSHEWSNTSEKEYFAAVAEAIKTPFLAKIRQLDRTEKIAAENHQPVSQEAKTNGLDDLF